MVRCTPYWICEASLTPLPFLGVSSLMNCRAFGRGFFWAQRIFGLRARGFFLGWGLCQAAFSADQSASARVRVSRITSAFRASNPGVGARVTSSM